MDRVQEIEAAIASLPPEQCRHLVDWFREREQFRWDEQMDQVHAGADHDRGLRRVVTVSN